MNERKPQLLVWLIWAIKHLCSCSKTGRRDMVGREILTADVLLFISTQDHKCNIFSRGKEEYTFDHLTFSRESNGQALVVLACYLFNKSSFVHFSNSECVWTQKLSTWEFLDPLCPIWSVLDFEIWCRWQFGALINQHFLNQWFSKIHIHLSSDI